MTAIVATKHGFPGKQASKACSSTQERSSVESIEKHCVPCRLLVTTTLPENNAWKHWDKTTDTELEIRLGWIFQADDSCF
ncbi:hypothetical protein TNCT_37081 [Trichonephila clavata]|uniref:Uncharacterized protein n=1 Tax=Trichonephila clavata TaxID=2740835 RepID=A0A8X6I9U3_TRICU|nr:hypothetical protein TNCT_37081 [Trichonephila clavata]